MPVATTQTKTKKAEQSAKAESKKKEKKAKIALPKLDPEEMISAYLHFGHRKSRTHPHMKPYVYTIRNNVSIIDLEDTKKYLEETLTFLGDLASRGGRLLFVATRLPGKDVVGELAKDLGMYYVSERWLGGTLTNFHTISSRLTYLKDLEAKKKSGEWQKYTKKERHDMDEELLKLNKKFDGIKAMEKLPDAVFIFNLHKDTLPAKEARSRGIPVVAVADTDADPKLADYFIPANDDAIQSVNYILDKVRDVIKGSAQERKSKT